MSNKKLSVSKKQLRNILTKEIRSYGKEQIKILETKIKKQIESKQREQMIESLGLNESARKHIIEHRNSIFIPILDEATGEKNYHAQDLDMYLKECMKDGKKTAEEKMEKAWAVMEESWDYEEQFFYGDPSSPGYYNPKSTNFYNRRAGSNDEVLQEFDLSGVMPIAQHLGQRAAGWIASLKKDWKKSGEEGEKNLKALKAAEEAYIKCTKSGKTEEECKIAEEDPDEFFTKRAKEIEAGQIETDEFDEEGYPKSIGEKAEGLWSKAREQWRKSKLVFFLKMVAGALKLALSLTRSVFSPLIGGIMKLVGGIVKSLMSAAFKMTEAWQRVKSFGMEVMPKLVKGLTWPFRKLAEKISSNAKEAAEIAPILMTITLSAGTLALMWICMGTNVFMRFTDSMAIGFKMIVQVVAEPAGEVAKGAGEAIAAATSDMSLKDLCEDDSQLAIAMRSRQQQLLTEGKRLTLTQIWEGYFAGECGAGLIDSDGREVSSSVCAYIYDQQRQILQDETNQAAQVGMVDYYREAVTSSGEVFTDEMRIQGQDAASQSARIMTTLRTTILDEASTNALAGNTTDLRVMAEGPMKDAWDEAIAEGRAAMAPGGGGGYVSPENLDIMARELDPTYKIDSVMKDQNLYYSRTENGVTEAFETSDFTKITGQKVVDVKTTSSGFEDVAGPEAYEAAQVDPESLEAAKQYVPGEEVGRRAGAPQRGFRDDAGKAFYPDKKKYMQEGLLKEGEIKRFKKLAGLLT